MKTINMKQFKWLYYSAIVLLILACLAHEAEARRRILKGRRTITRTYYKAAAIPAWAIILLVSLGELLVGAAIFFVMKRAIVDPPLSGTYSPPAQIP